MLNQLRISRERQKHDAAGSPSREHSVRKAVVLGGLVAFAVLFFLTTRANAGSVDYTFDASSRGPDIGRAALLAFAAFAVGAFAGWRGFEIQRKRASHPQNAMISTAPRTFTADRGEPSLSATASAPIQRDEPPASVRSLVRTPLFTVVGGLRIESKVTNGQAAAESSVTPVANEAFDATYLAALKNEGIELPLFLRNWNRAMADDLDTVDAARNAYRVAMRTALHRISGAAGLVGAHRLMDALREAGTPAVELDDRTIDALIERIQSLITQFEKAGDPLWSPSR